MTAFVSSIVMLILLLIFMVIFIEFLFCKQPKLVKKKRSELLEVHAEKIDSNTRRKIF